MRRGGPTTSSQRSPAPSKRQPDGDAESRRLLASLFRQVRVGELQVGPEIGRGRFKRVNKATWKEPSSDEEREVVLLQYMKKCPPSEMQLLSFLMNVETSHEYIPEIFGACTLKGDGVLIQEWAPWGALKGLNAEHPEAFSKVHQLVAAKQVCFAMAFLAYLRIVHNDLSCRNVLVFELDAGQPEATRVKVTDFGLAVRLPEGQDFEILKQAQAIRWCAPETVGRSRLSLKSDVWMLGMTLWELFCQGQSPWPRFTKRNDVAELLTQLSGLEPPSLSWEEHQPFEAGFPATIANLIQSCWRIPELERPSAGGLGEAFRAILEPPEPEARPPRRPPAPCKPRLRKLKTHSKVAACPESVKRVMENPQILMFADWAAGNWIQLHKIFTEERMGRHAFEIGPQSVIRLSREQWNRIIALKGFKGDANVVFDAIAREVLVQERPDSNHISLTQLQRFEAKAVATTSMPVCADLSAAGRFTRFLKQKRGSVLRAWRLDVDKRGTGSVAYTDFVAACKRLGLVGQARQIWDCVRGEGSFQPLEFHELDSDEVSNLEEFIDFVYCGFNRDLEELWGKLDGLRRGMLTEEEFVEGLKFFGFAGNGQQLYRGLDSSGIGRLHPDDFRYVWKACARSHCHDSQKSMALPRLVQWLRGEGVTPPEFLQDLGLCAPGRAAVEVNDLAARFTAVGFNGHARRAASEISQLLGGSAVPVAAFRALLEERYQALGAGGSPPGRGASPGSSRVASPRSAGASGKEEPLTTTPSNLEEDEISDWSED